MRSRASRRLRTEPMRKLASLIQERGWAHPVAAGNCGITQPRIIAVSRSQASRCCLDTSVDLAAALGRNLQVGPARLARIAAPAQSASGS
jgi:predicted XRE-type DNA-binding protein